MAVRGATLFYADTAEDVLRLAASGSHHRDVHVIDLRSCRAEHCPKETDDTHLAFKLITIEVTMHCLSKYNNVLFQILQGRELLWSTSNATLKLAILETIGRCGAPNRAAAALPQ